MLDLIFANRVVDLCDSLYCSDRRDGVMAGLYANNDRNLVSKIKTTTKAFNRKMDKLMESLEGKPAE